MRCFSEDRNRSQNCRFPLGYLRRYSFPRHTLSNFPIIKATQYGRGSIPSSAFAVQRLKLDSKRPMHGSASGCGVGKPEVEAPHPRRRADEPIQNHTQRT